jgi:hypothetical protein
MRLDMAKITHEITIRMSLNEAKAAQFALGKLSMQHYDDENISDEIRLAGRDLYACLNKHLPARDD